DIDLYNASGQLVSLLPGASFFDSLYAHGMARGGRVTTVVLGAFQVSEQGDLANWNVPASGKGGIGGAMDLAAGRARVLAVTHHPPPRGAQPHRPRGHRHVRLRRGGLRPLRGGLPPRRTGLWRAPAPAGGAGGRRPDVPQERPGDPRESIQPAAGGARLAHHG